MANFFNEMTADGMDLDASADIREHYRDFSAWLKQQAPETIERKRAEADLTFRRVGITSPCTGTTPAPSA
jgi:uncharacterized circularly permuted ATP-grasp superfamily protein